MSLPSNNSTSHNDKGALPTSRTPTLQGYWPSMPQQLRHEPNYQVPFTNIDGYIDSLLDHQEDQGLAVPCYDTSVAGPSTLPASDLFDNDFKLDDDLFDSCRFHAPTPPLDPGTLNASYALPFTPPYDRYPQDPKLYTQEFSATLPPPSTSPRPHIGLSNPMPPTISPPMPFSSTLQLGPNHATSSALSLSPSSQDVFDSFMTGGTLSTPGVAEQETSSFGATDDLLFLQGLLGLNSTLPSNVDPKSDPDTMFSLPNTFGDSTSPLFLGEPGPTAQDHILVTQHQQGLTTQVGHFPFPSLGIPQSDLNSNWYHDHLNVPPLDALTPIGNSTPSLVGGRSSAVLPYFAPSVLQRQGTTATQVKHSQPVRPTTKSDMYTQKRGRDSSESGDGPEAKRSRRASKGVGTGIPTHRAVQLSPALPRGDGEAIPHRGQLGRVSTDAHVPEQTTDISAASDQAGAPTESELGTTLAAKARERAILQASIGTPAPDLRSFVEGKKLSLNAIWEKIYRDLQICRHTHDGEQICGKTFQDADDRVFKGECTKHYNTHHRDCCNPEPGEWEVVCSQAGCGQKHNHRDRARHIQTKAHALADLRFLRHVCPHEDCRKTIKFVPGSIWYEYALRDHMHWSSKEVIWKIVDEEPNMDDYVVRKGKGRRRMGKGKGKGKHQ